MSDDRNEIENAKPKTWYEKLSEKVESHALRLTIWTTIAILVGGLVEIPPFFLMPQVKKIETVKPYNALELAGRDVYQQEGCFNCHTQMIRPFKWETDRWDPAGKYGPEPYSKAGEYVYDHPFLWGSKRTGPDLQHTAATTRATYAWQKSHLIDPRDAVEGSIMPSYAYLFEYGLDAESTKARMRSLRAIGVPYSDEDIEKADELLKGKTEGDALIAYLLKLGRDTIVEQ